MAVRGLCAVFLVLFGLKGGNGCPHNGNWVTFHGNCYSFPDDKLSWFGAVIACQNVSATLADITSKAEDDFIRGRLQHLRVHGSTGSYWIRANDLAVEGKWVWGFPSEVPMTYTNWGPGEPNGHKEATGEAELCVCMWGGSSYKWNDLACSMKEYYICKAGHSSSETIVG